MQYDKQLIHCDEAGNVAEIESYVVEDGLIISMKQFREGDHLPFEEMRRRLEQEGWEIEHAGVIMLGKQHQPANSYSAMRMKTD
jgi:hypothetical protein